MSWKSIAAEIERTATARGRAASGRFSIEGFRLLERAVATGVTIDAVLVGESSLRKADRRAEILIDKLEQLGVEIATAPDLGLSQLIEGRETGAVTALLPIPEPVTLDSIADAEGSKRLLVAVQVDDPGNVGALTRTALAGGAEALVLIGPGDPYHPRAVRISRGSLFRLPVVRLDSTEALLDAAQRWKLRTVAAITHGGEPLDQFQPEGDDRVAICVGSEAFGLSEEFVEQLDWSTTIPMTAGVDSYSVHAAAAILLYALRR